MAVKLKKELTKLGKTAMGYVGTLIYIVVIIVIIIIIAILALHSVKAVLFHQSFDYYMRANPTATHNTKEKYLKAIKVPSAPLGGISYKDELFTVLHDIDVLQKHIKFDKAKLGIS